MFAIRPTTATIAAGATAADYTAYLPDVPVSFSGEREISTAKTISGGAATSTWAKSIDGYRVVMPMLISAATYAIVLRIDQSAYTSWILQAQGRTFSVALDLTSAIPQKVYGADWWRISLTVVILDELHR